MEDAARRAEFTRCWQTHVGRVVAYARRHVGADEANDVAAEAFLHAWRRWSDVPEPPLPWLIGTARKIIGNRRRGTRRRAALVDRLALLEASSLTADAADVAAEERRLALHALATLSPDDREAILLIAWDGLGADEAASVLGVRPATLRARLHRARNRLQSIHDELCSEEEVSWHAT
jgi:RNA polymerase sigma factor (sigma-70 family)